MNATSAPPAPNSRHWWALHIHDPGGQLRGRALRIALLVPLEYFLLVDVLHQPVAGLPAAMATLSILSFAALGGPPGDRLRANLILGALGVALFGFGSLLSAPAWVAITSTLLVVFCISLASVFRGYFAAASTAAIVPWVVAVTTAPDREHLLAACSGWAFGALVAAAGAALLWPSHPLSSLRSGLADALDAAAGLVDQVAESPHTDATREAWQAVLGTLRTAHQAYDGRLVRPGAGTSRDRSLMLAFDQVHRLRTVLHVWVDSDDHGIGPADEQLAAATAATLRQCASALRRGRGITGADELGAARDAHQEALNDWAIAHAVQFSPEVFSRELNATFHVRVASLSTQILAIYVQGSLDSRDETFGRRAQRHVAPVTFGDAPVFQLNPKGRRRRILRSQLNLQSPWFRGALRTALAMAITVGVVQLTGAQHGFWVPLGALVALKVDVSATRRTALQVAVGTVVGFVLASGLILVVGNNVVVYWLLLPFLAFLAAYSSGAISLGAGQAAFTVFVLTLLAIGNQGLLDTGLIRVTDVAIGLGVSLLVSFLIWPRGIAPAVRSTLHSASQASGAYLVSAYVRLVEGPIAQDGLDEAHRDARTALSVASEAFDLALTQGGPHQETSVPIWTSVLNSTAQIAFAASLVSVLPSIAPLSAAAAPSGDAMLALSHHVQAELARDTYPGGRNDRPVVGGATSGEALDRLRGLVDRDIAAIWRDTPPAIGGVEAMVLVFAQAWLAQCVWMVQRVEARIAEEPASAAKGSR